MGRSLRLWLTFVVAVFSADATHAATTADAPAAVPLSRVLAFRVNRDGLLLDDRGAPVPAEKVRDHLKQFDLAGVATVALWIEESEAAKNLTPTIAAFDGRFSTIIVKHLEPADKTGLIELPLGQKPDHANPIVTAYPGRAYPASATSADFTARDPQLRPGPVPPQVRYRYADNATVERTAAQLSRHFGTAAAANDDALWSGAVVVQSGAWKLFSADPALGRTHADRFTARVPARGLVLELPQILLRDAAEIRTLDTRVRAIVAADGGARLRALQSAEMKTWWQFIGFDLTEPVFVLETANRRHRFILGLNQDGIALLDELNHLPGSSATAPAGPTAATPPAPSTPAAPAAAATPLPVTPLTLKAGQTAILVSGQTVLFPPGTTICVSGGRNLIVNGQHNTVNASPGTIVAVPLNATGDPDNRVVAP